MKGETRGLLQGVFVLDLADEQGQFCTRLLADLGATVVKVESPQGDPSRNSPAFLCCNTNKLGIVLDLDTPGGKRAFRRLIRLSDILVETLSAGRVQALQLDEKRLKRINPRLIHISITGFGRTGPKRAYRSCDAVASAAGGQTFVTRTPDGAPAQLFGGQSGYVASLFGANAAILALRKRALTGKGSYADLSAQEAVASTLDPVRIDYLHDGRVAADRRAGNPDDSFAVLPCRDGHIQLTVFRNWETLLELMRAEGKASELLDPKWRQKSYRAKHRRRILDAVSAWSRTHTRKDLFELGQAMQFPWAPIASPEEVVRSPQLRARRFFVRARLRKSNRGIPVPGLPFKCSRFAPPPLKPPPLLGEHTRQVLQSLEHSPRHCAQVLPARRIASGDILRGFRVIDLTRMLSGPYATRILGDFGAEVVKVQSRLTAHGAERADSAYFRAWNRNKRSVSLNLNYPEARSIFLELVSVSDVVVENYSPRVLSNWGLTYERLRKAKPDLIMVSISAMGQTGPWKNHVGYAPTFHALSGLLSASSPSPDALVDLGNAYGDVIAGLYASLAVLASIERREATGQGQYVDLSSYEALCALLGPAFVKAAQNRSPEVCGCYPCRGSDRWCAICIAGEAEWQAFCRICGDAALKLGKYSTSSGRRKHRTELDAAIGRWTGKGEAETVARRLQDAGIPAAVAQNAEDLARDRHLAARRFFVSLQHPASRTDIADRSALWPWREPTSHWKPAPALGADNRHVLRKILGYSRSRIQSLIKAGILE